jgi:hypothetical protein
VGNDDRVLSQDEIDALLSKTLPSASPAKAGPPMPTVQQIKVTSPPPPPKVVSQTKAAPPPPPPKANAPAPQPVPVSQGPTPEQVANLCKQIITEQTKDLQKMVQDLQKNEIELTIKVNKLSNPDQRIDQLEEKIDQLTALVKSSPKAIRALESRIVEIYGLLDAMRQEKHQSDEGRIHDEFQCVNCHSKKLVAIHVKCTSCGHENWMGWFPDSKEK